MDSKQYSEKYLIAKKRIEEIKKFYKHITFYVLVNLVFIGNRIYKDISSGDSVVEAFLDLSNYKIFFWWGIIVLLHATNVFGKERLFSKSWEERKIKEYLDKN